jgi:hypothetical protein
LNDKKKNSHKIELECDSKGTNAPLS